MNTTQLTEAMESAGQTIRDLMDKTGLSDEGVRQCLKRNQLPRNPVVSRLFASAINLPDGWTPSAPSPTAEQTTQSES